MLENNLQNDEWVLIDTALHSRIVVHLFHYVPEFSKVKDIRKEEKISDSRIFGKDSK